MAEAILLGGLLLRRAMLFFTQRLPSQPLTPMAVDSGVPCNQGSHARSHTDQLPATTPVATGLTTDDGTRLIVSNAPETLGSQIASGSYPATLYACAVPCGPEVRLRILLSHINNTGSKLYFGVRAKATFLASIFDGGILVRTGTTTDDLRTAGMCLSAGHLYQTLDAYTLPTTQLGQTEVTLWSSQAIGTGTWNSICAVIELTIKPHDFLGHCDFRIVATKDPANWGQPGDPVVGAADPTGVVHIRGWWPYSNIVLAQTLSQTVDCCEDAQYQCVIGAGDDLYAFRNLDPVNGTAHGNNGLYGVNASYKFSVNNKCPDDQTVDCYLRARNVGAEGKFWGAARIVDFTKLKVDKIRYSAPPNEALLNLCSLNDGGGPITVPGLTILPVERVLEFASGISAEMPVNLLATTVGI